MSDDKQVDEAQGQDAPAPEAHAEAGGGMMNKGRRKPLLIGLVVIVLAAGLLYFLYDVFIGSRKVSTDNAYVGGENAQITPLTSGRVVAVYVTDTQAVKKGQILFKLEDADQRIAFDQARAMVVLTERRFRQSSAQVASAGAMIQARQAAVPEATAKLASARADLAKAQAEYGRRSGLVATGAVSAEEATAARAALAAAQASVREAEAGIGQAQANVASARADRDAGNALIAGATAATAPEVLAAKTQLAQAQLNLSRTVVRAPFDGVVGRRSIQVGQKLDAGTVAMVVVPVGRLYVDANFKETQLGKVRPGQRATLTSDFYGDDVEFHGTVVGFAGGTGAAFSLIPAQNATGNWIKVVQRLPVRIALDPKELEKYPLRIGLSMEASIDLTNGGD